MKMRAYGSHLRVEQRYFTLCKWQFPLKHWLSNTTPQKKVQNITSRKCLQAFMQLDCPHQAPFQIRWCKMAADREQCHCYMYMRAALYVFINGVCLCLGLLLNNAEDQRGQTSKLPFHSTWTNGGVKSSCCPMNVASCMEACKKVCPRA